MKYSRGFRASIVRQTLDRNGRSIHQIAKETGVSYGTIVSWVEKHRVGKLDIDDTVGITPNQRSAGETLTLLLESKSMDDEGQGESLRRHGLHSEHLPLWEQELTAMMNDKQSDLKKKNAELHKENKSLSQELQRTEKALAEAAVLLTLKKSSTH